MRLTDANSAVPLQISSWNNWWHQGKNGLHLVYKVCILYACTFLTMCPMIDRIHREYTFAFVSLHSVYFLEEVYLMVEQSFGNIGVDLFDLDKVATSFVNSTSSFSASKSLVYTL